MFSEISVLNFLIYAAGIGFAAAIIYTNIQRTALSRFISFLIDNNCLDEQSAVTLDDIGLSAIQKRIIKSAVKQQHGFKRSVACISSNTSSLKNDNEDAFFDAIDNSKYFLSDSDTDTLKKKYYYKTMPTWLVALFVAVLAVVVILTSFFAGWLIDVMKAPKTEVNNSDNVGMSESVIEENIQDDSTLNENEASDPSEENENVGDKTTGPRIPI